MHWSYCDITTVSDDALQSAYKNLSPSRKEHIDRLRRKEDKTRSLAGEILAQALLKEHYGIRTAKLHRHTSGQPYFSGCDLHISICHCDQMVACAISDKPVGMDIERIRPVNLKLCRHVCTPEEAEYVLGCEDDSAFRFFEVWTAKEAYFKKCGTGITDLKSVNILSLPRQLHRVGDYLLQIM